MPYNSETETFYQAPATVVDSTPDGDTVQEGFDDRLTPAMAGVYADFNLLKADGMISVGIPATTTARGIGRVATQAQWEEAPSSPDDGPFFLAAGTYGFSVAPAAGKIPIAGADGKIDPRWNKIVDKINQQVPGGSPIPTEIHRSTYSDTWPEFLVGVNEASLPGVLYSVDINKIMLTIMMRGITAINVAPGANVVVPSGGTWLVFFIAFQPDSWNAYAGSARAYILPGGHVIPDDNAFVRRGFAVRIA